MMAGQTPWTQTICVGANAWRKSQHGKPIVPQNDYSLIATKSRSLRRIKSEIIRERWILPEPVALLAAIAGGRVYAIARSRERNCESIY